MSSGLYNQLRPVISQLAEDISSTNERLQRQQGIIAEAFSAQSTYDVGDSVIYEAGLYTFRANKVAGAWDATKVDGPFKVTEQISNLKEDLQDINEILNGDVEEATRSINKTNSATYIGVNDTKTLFSASQGDTITVNVSGTAIQDGAVTRIYVWYAGKTTATLKMSNQPIGVNIALVLDGDIDAVGATPSPLAQGTIIITARKGGSGGVLSDLENINADLGKIQTATSEDVGKVITVNAVTNGKVTDWKFSDISGLGEETKFTFSQRANYIYIGMNDAKVDFVARATDKLYITMSGDTVVDGESTLQVYTRASGSDDYSIIIPRFTYSEEFEFTLTSDITGIAFAIGSLTQLTSVSNVYITIKVERYDIPNYYTEYIQGKIDRINQLALTCVANGDVFAFITDEHWTLNQKNSPKLLKILNDKCYFSRLFSGGDTADIVSKQFCDALRASYPHEIHHIVGNHDVMDTGTSNMMYYYFDMYNNNQIGNAFEHYYYVDNYQQKIRYVVLASYRHISSGNHIENGYTQEQITWLTSEALNIPTGWSVIVFAHDAMGYSTGWADVKTALDTAKTGGKDIICIMAGHAHYDAINHTTGGIPIIITTCDKNGAWIDSQQVDREPWLTQYRIPGTTSEQAFDIVFVDKTNRQITCVRIGALAMDNTDITQSSEGFTYEGTLEERVVSY